MTDFATLGIKITSTGAAKAENELGRLERQSVKVDKSIESVIKTIDKLRNYMTLGFLGVGINQLLQMSDKMKTLATQVRFVTQTTAEYERVQQSLFEISQQTRASLEATTTIYTRTSRALRDYGYSQQQVLTFTETLNKAMAVGGVGAQEQATALFQLSQALGSGRLQGDEFRTIAEAAPIILDVVAEYMGKSRAEIKKLAGEGVITSKVIFEAISGANKKISQQFEGMPITFGQAMQQMENAVLKFVDEMLNGSGVTNGLAEAVSFLAKNFNYLVIVMGSVAAGHLAKLANNALLSALNTQKQAVAALQAAQAVKVQTSAELQLARVQMNSLASSLKLAQSETTRKTIRAQMVAQSERIIALTNAETAATQRLATAQKAASLGGRLAGGVLGLLGGPVGIVTTALIAGAGAFYEWYSNAQQAKQEALDYANNLDIANNKLKEMSLLELQVAKDKLSTTIDEQKKKVKELEGAISSLKEKAKIMTSYSISTGLPDAALQDLYEKKLKEIREKKLELQQAKEAVSESTKNKLH